MRALLLVHRSPSSHMAVGVEELSRVSSVRALVPFMRAQTSWPSHLPNDPPPGTDTLGMSFQHMNFGVAGGHKHSVYSGIELLEVKEPNQLGDLGLCLIPPLSFTGYQYGCLILFGLLQQNYTGWVAYNEEIYFSHSIVWKSKIKVSAWLSGGLLPG